MAPRQSYFDLGNIGGSLEDYAKGAIVYIYLENFVTYDQCELYPGPYMNMIMGPNGTGKSSVVAAVALGLGWHPNVLGRSKDAGEFIKYGRERAVIEIVLRMSGQIEGDGVWRDDGVVVLRRELGRNKNMKNVSEWFLNGNPCAAKLVAQIMRELNVQVDNLCQFLPQDKVSEFAKLSPADLLIETEKAAAGPIVYEQHRLLIELRAKERESITQVEEEKRRLEKLRKQNENIEASFQRIRQREQHLKTINLLERKRPWLMYNAARDAYMESKSKRDLARNQLELAGNQTNPLKKQLAAKQDLLNKAEKKNRTVNGKADVLRGEISNLLNDELPEMTGNISNRKTQIIKLREQKAKKEASIFDLRRTIRLLEEEVAAGCPHKDQDPFRRELNDANRQINDNENDLEDAEKAIGGIGKEGDRLNHEINDLCAKLRQLEDVKEQRLAIVRTMNLDVFQTYQWIQQNRDKFKEPIYGPMCIEIDVKDPSVARQVESSISRGNLLNFVVTNFDDCELFMRKVESMGWESNVTFLENSDISQARTAIDKGELKRLGFMGTVLDFVDGPEPVIASLVDVAKIHMIPIAKSPIDPKNVENIRYLQKYATPEGTFEFRRSNYSDDIATRCLSLKNATFFSQSSSDERKRELVDRISERRGQQSRNQEKMKELLQERERLRTRQGECKEKREEVVRERNLIIREIAEWTKKSSLIDLKKSNLQNLLANNEEESEEGLKEELRQMYKDYAEITLEASRRIMNFKDMIFKMGTEQLSMAKIEGEIARLQDEILQAESQHDNLRLILAEAEATLTEQKRKAKELLDQASRCELDEETRNLFSELPETLEELDKMLIMEKTRLEVAGDSSTVSDNTARDYETRKEQIDALQISLSRLQTEQEVLRGDMERISSEWLPALEVMVDKINERFSAFFSLMNCAGQVRLAPKDREYSEHCLEILVKFRDNESLQILSAQRQSGGEKSVSTILYLLALQELAKSPFRVVDEINQGMDAINERRIHSLIVETATRAAKSQYCIKRILLTFRYFLITPKLLGGLEYHERMHVLCVFNGEGVPPLA